MSQGFSTGQGSYDEMSSQQHQGEGLSVDGGSIDRNSGLSAGLKGGQGNMDAQRGLNEGFDGGIGENEYQGSGFDAGPKGSGNGGGVTLDGGDGGDVDQYGEQAGGLKQKMKDAGQNIKDKLSNN